MFSVDLKVRKQQFGCHLVVFVSNQIEFILNILQTKCLCQVLSSQHLPFGMFCFVLFLESLNFCFLLAVVFLASTLLSFPFVLLCWCFSWSGSLSSENLAHLLLQRSEWWSELSFQCWNFVDLSYFFHMHILHLTGVVYKWRHT